MRIKIMFTLMNLYYRFNFYLCGNITEFNDSIDMINLIMC